MTHNALMHGTNRAGQDVTGWIAQEKFDGWRALWTGKRLITRQGQAIRAPRWFTDGLPSSPLDCELFLGRGRVNEMQRIAWNSGCPLWMAARLIIFDAPTASGGIIERLATVSHSSAYAIVAETFTVESDIMERLAELKLKDGEGFMLRHPSAPYVAGRTDKLLKLK